MRRKQSPPGCADVDRVSMALLASGMMPSPYSRILPIAVLLYGAWAQRAGVSGWP